MNQQTHFHSQAKQAKCGMIGGTIRARGFYNSFCDRKSVRPGLRGSTVNFEAFTTSIHFNAKRFRRDAFIARTLLTWIKTLVP